MKVAVCSDLHLEFGDLVLKNTDGVDVLILSGDICVARALLNVDAALDRTSERFHNFFKQVCLEFPDVVYVMGNHEHYDGDFATTYDIIKERLSYLPNLHFLEKETVKLGDITFIGGTLWTDMNGGDTSTLHAIRSMMNDFRIVDNSNKKVYSRVPLYKRDSINTLTKHRSKQIQKFNLSFESNPAINAQNTAIKSTNIII